MRSKCDANATDMLSDRRATNDWLDSSAGEAPSPDDK